MAYARAVKQFFDWCDERRLQLRDIEAISVATYIEQLGTQASKPTPCLWLARERRRNLRHGCARLPAVVYPSYGAGTSGPKRACII